MSTVDTVFGLARAPGVAAGRWVTPSINNDMVVHRLHSSYQQAGEAAAALIDRVRRSGRRLALCGLVARSWQDITSCPPGAAPFPRCEPCERELHRRADADLRQQITDGAPAIDHRPLGTTGGVR